MEEERISAGGFGGDRELLLGGNLGKERICAVGEGL